MKGRGFRSQVFLILLRSVLTHSIIEWNTNSRGLGPMGLYVVFISTTTIWNFQASHHEGRFFSVPKTRPTTNVSGNFAKTSSGLWGPTWSSSSPRWPPWSRRWRAWWWSKIPASQLLTILTQNSWIKTYEIRWSALGHPSTIGHWVVVAAQR